MKRHLKVLEKILGRLLHPAESYTYLGSIFRSLMLDGTISIETAFEYQPIDKNKIHRFRTTIQLDGDIINVVPGSNTDDSDWQAVFQNAYRIHREKLRHFVSQLDGIRTIAWVTGAIISAIPTVCSWKFGPSKLWGYALGWMYLILWPILAYFMRKYVLRIIFRLCIRIGAWLNRKRLRIA